MTGIPFTQFLRPDGERRAVFIDRPKDIELIAEAFIHNGGWFECEELRGGTVSLCACKVVNGESQDIEQELVPNGPGVPAAVDRLVQKVRHK
jgi:hypothetical protein